jgi:hypothetical protein
MVVAMVALFVALTGTAVATTSGPANVTHPEVGVYCFVGLPFAVHAVSVAPDDYGPDDPVLVNTFHGARRMTCVGIPRVRVMTAVDPTVLSDHAFCITFNQLGRARSRGHATARPAGL